MRPGRRAGRPSPAVGGALRSPPLLLLGVLALLLGGCASQAPVYSHFDPFAGSPPEKLPLWPQPPAQPRLQFAGVLRGETNFVLEKSDDVKSGMTRAFAWLAGIGEENDGPLLLQRPQNGVVDGRGRIVVTDVGLPAVVVFDRTEKKFQIWPHSTENGAPFLTPVGIALGPDDTFLVTDADQERVIRLSADGKPLGSFGQEVLQRPTGIARSAERGLIYVADTDADNIKVFNDAGELVDLIAWRGKEAGTLNAPTFLALSENGIYVTDTFNARIQLFDYDGRLINHFGRRGEFVGNFSRPKGVATDDRGHIFVVESYFDHLLIFNPAGQLLLPINGSGVPEDRFSLPSGVWIDGDGMIYVADTFRGRVVMYKMLEFNS